MTNVFFISDLHLGHKNIVKFEQNRLGYYVDNIDEHDALLEECWHDTVRNKDLVYVLGDVAFNIPALERFALWPGRKILIAGNHDTLKYDYWEIFDRIFGVIAYKDFWLSHCPVHPDEIRGKVNVHGHMHSKTIDDPRYFNVSVEQLQGIPMSLEELKARAL
tara:strand:- start:6 stop:491 length:486 start_codon:yes stop_codon:yes gene_type:complete